MAYIRSNEDYDRSIGLSAKESRVQSEMNRRRVDYGVCNPIKAKIAAEEEDEIRAEIEREFAED
jgi:hypothetical protein